MECNIGLLLEFQKKYPKIVRRNDLTMGITCPEKDEMWIFVDKIAFFEQHKKYIMDALISITIHELIHLCGVLNEDMTKFGEKLVRYNDK